MIIVFLIIGTCAALQSTAGRNGNILKYTAEEKLEYMVEVGTHYPAITSKFKIDAAGVEFFEVYLGNLIQRVMESEGELKYHFIASSNQDVTISFLRCELWFHTVNVTARKELVTPEWHNNLVNLAQCDNQNNGTIHVIIRGKPGTVGNFEFSIVDEHISEIDQELADGLIDFGIEKTESNKHVIEIKEEEYKDIDIKIFDIIERARAFNQLAVKFNHSIENGTFAIGQCENMTTSYPMDSYFDKNGFAMGESLDRLSSLFHVQCPDDKQASYHSLKLRVYGPKQSLQLIEFQLVKYVEAPQVLPKKKENIVFLIVLPIALMFLLAAVWRHFDLIRTSTKMAKLNRQRFQALYGGDKTYENVEAQEMEVKNSSPSVQDENGSNPDLVFL